MNKAELRKLYMEKRAALTENVATGSSQRIAARFFAEVSLTGVNRLHTFIPIRRFNEVDTSLIYRRLWRDFPSIATYAPRIDATRTRLDTVRLTERTALTENKWGIREPVGEDSITPDQLDLVLVPLLCFDHLGNRLGYGQGFYDRMLAECRPDCVKVGLSYFSPIGKIPEIHEGDVRLDVSVTPDELFRF